MATTTNYSFTLPTVGGSEDQWGTNLNANWTSLDTTLLGFAPKSSPTFTGTATIPTAAITTVDFGDWTITEASGVLKFATGGVNKMSLDASGNLTVVGNVNTAGTIA
jgi:hypothetical protein